MRPEHQYRAKYQNFFITDNKFYRAMNKVIQFFPARQIRRQPFLLEQLQSQAQLFNQARGEVLRSMTTPAS
jgi:hypothetical protein